MGDDLLDAATAAEALGVSRATLYAYVSRGLLTSEPGPGPGRERRYPRAAIEQLRANRGRTGPTSGARASLFWGLPVVDSALTLIQDGQLFYRGHSATALSDSTSLEVVAELLWTGRRDRISGEFPMADGRRAPSDESLASALSQALLRAAESTSVTLSTPREANHVRAAALVATIFAAAGARGAGPLAERLARGWQTNRVDDLNAALVLCADHELNVSSFTARCVASADTKLEQVVIAALAALQGRRHGGQYLLVEELLGDSSRHGMRRAIDRCMVAQGGVPGFGHRLYPGGDPRATALLRRAGLGSGRATDISRLIDVAEADFGLRPNLDLGLVALVLSMGLPADRAFALFALGRSVGWIAHAFEAWDDGRLVRPRARYVGEEPVSTSVS